MKRTSLLFAACMLATLFSFAQYSNLKFSPEQPKPGDKIHFEYSPAGTVLGGVNDFQTVAYLEDGAVRAQEISVHQQGDKWVGEIVTNDTTKTLLLVFKKDVLIDNNKEQGYTLMMMENGEPVKGAYMSRLNLNSFGGFLAEMKVKPEDNLQLYEKEFARNPASRQQYLSGYTGILMRVDKDNAAAKYSPILEELLNKKEKTENEYFAIMSTYNVLKDKENSDKYKAEMLAKFPKGMQAKNDMRTAFYSEADLKKKEDKLKEIVKAYPPKTAADKTTMDILYSNMAEVAGTKKDWVLMKKYADKVSDKSNLANSYNSIAWELVGQGMEGKGEELDMAKNLSAKSLEYTRAAKESMTAKQPYQTTKEYRDNMDYSFGNSEDTYALILWKRGEKEKAMEAQEDAMKMTKNNNTDIAERYIVFKEEVKGPNSVKTELEDLIRNGKSTPKMKDILKEVYTKDHSEAEYTVYLDGLLKEFREKTKEELMKKMINEAAPQFALKDISGNTVSLESLKGKVVVVDFWATWCGPCRASFPAMQTAQNRYKDDPDVKFVFVDSWESKKPEEILKSADDFIKKNKYSFHVLLDNDDKVIQSYAVEGIPTKFVIDPTSRIRFKAVGFGGNADQLVDEVSIMIDALKTGGDKKGF